MNSEQTPTPNSQPSETPKELDAYKKAIAYREKAINFIHLQLKCLKTASLTFTSGIEKLLRVKTTLLAYREAGLIDEKEASNWMCQAFTILGTNGDAPCIPSLSPSLN